MLRNKITQSKIVYVRAVIRKIKDDLKFIIGSDLHLISWFCEIVLDSNTIYKKISYFLQDLL